MEERIERNTPGNKDYELWQWGIKERKRLKVTGRQFLKMLGFSSNEGNLFTLYTESTPTRKLAFGNAILNKLEELYGQDLQSLKPQENVPIKDIIEDIFYNNHSWFVEDIGIETLFFREEGNKEENNNNNKGDCICSLLLKGDRKIDGDRALNSLKMKIKEEGYHYENGVEFKILKSKYL